jgi:hypothetical protein
MNSELLLRHSQSSYLQVLQFVIVERSMVELEVDG